MYVYIYILISHNIVHVRSDRSSASWIRINKLLQAGNGHPNENIFTLSTLKSCRRFFRCLQSCSKMDIVSLGKTHRRKKSTNFQCFMGCQPYWTSVHIFNSCCSNLFSDFFHRIVQTYSFSNQSPSSIKIVRPQNIQSLGFLDN